MWGLLYKAVVPLLPHRHMEEGGLWAGSVHTPSDLSVLSSRAWSSSPDKDVEPAPEVLTAALSLSLSPLGLG